MWLRSNRWNGRKRYWTVRLTLNRNRFRSEVNFFLSHYQMKKNSPSIIVYATHAFVTLIDVPIVRRIRNACQQTTLRPTTITSTIRQKNRPERQRPMDHTNIKRVMWPIAKNWVIIRCDGSGSWKWRSRSARCWIWIWMDWLWARCQSVIITTMLLVIWWCVLCASGNLCGIIFTTFRR